MKWQNKWYIKGLNFGPWVEMAKLLFWPASQRESSTTRVFSIGGFLIYARTVSHCGMNDGKTNNLCVREGFCGIGIHNFTLTKPLSSNGLIPKRSTDYYATIIMCLASSYAALPLCYVLNISLLFYIFDIVCDGITREALDTQNKGVRAHYFCLSALRLWWKWNEQANKIFSGWNGLKFVVPLTTGSLCWHCLTSCRVVKGAGTRMGCVCVCVCVVGGGGVNYNILS